MENEIEIQQEEIKEWERVKMNTLTIIGIVAIEDKEQKFITQIRFKLNEGNDLTYKPQKEIEEKTDLNGLEVLRNWRESITKEEIPEKIYKLNNLIKEMKEIRVVTNHTVKNRIENGKLIDTYPILTESDFNGLYPIDKDNKEIKLK